MTERWWAYKIKHKTNSGRYFHAEISSIGGAGSDMCFVKEEDFKKLKKKNKELKKELKFYKEQYG